MQAETMASSSSTMCGSSCSIPKAKEKRIKINMHSSGRGGAGNIRASALDGSKANASKAKSLLSDRDSIMTATTTSTATSKSSQASSSFANSHSSRHWSRTTSITSESISIGPTSPLEFAEPPPSPVNIAPPSSFTAQTYTRPTIDENMSITFGREFAVQPSKSGRTGRGGAGTLKNILGDGTEYTDAKQYPQTAALMQDHKRLIILQERAIIERSREAAKTRHSTGRGGAGNLMLKKQSAEKTGKPRRRFLYMTRPPSSRPQTSDGAGLRPRPSSTTSYSDLRSKGPKLATERNTIYSVIDITSSSSRSRSFSRSRSIHSVRSTSIHSTHSAHSMHSTRSSSSSQSSPNHTHAMGIAKLWKRMIHPSRRARRTKHGDKDESCSSSSDTAEEQRSGFRPRRLGRGYSGDIPLSTLSLSLPPERPQLQTRASSVFEHTFFED